jgi:fructokinase
MFRIGYDVGGTKIEVAVLDADSKIILRERKKTEREKGYQHILSVIEELYAKALVKIDNKKHSVGLGLPGTIHPETLRMIEGNTQAWVGPDIKSDLSQIFKAPFKVENDANCFALAEVQMGAGLKFQRENKIKISDQIAIGIILGTGCGGGVYHCGKILSGAHGGGGEIGHSLLVSDGRSCYCGRKGCVESYVSGPAIESIYFETTGVRKSSADIFLKQDQASQKIIADFIEHLTVFFANLATLFDPHYLVLGGGISNQVQIYPILNEAIKGRPFLKKYVPLILKPELGDSAGVIGAAFLN